MYAVCAQLYPTLQPCSPPGSSVHRIFWQECWSGLPFPPPGDLPVKVMVFLVVMYGCESWTTKKADAKELMLLNCGVGEDS